MLKRTLLCLKPSNVPSYSCSSSHFSTKPISKPTQANFHAAVKEAEKVVGYPTSFLNLRWLLNDEVANVATHVKKLVHVEHPLIDTVKGFLFKTDVPTFGLIVLLVAKCGGLNNVKSAIDIDYTAGILHSQRILAEVADMIRTSVLIHRGLLNPCGKFAKSTDLLFGNKLALLCGDYILSKCFNDLANIKNHDVNDLISSTLRDLTENEFLGQRDEQNLPLPTKPCDKQANEINLIEECGLGPYKINDILGHCKPEWFLRNILGGANLLGKSCQASCILTNQDKEMQRTAFLLGKYIGLVWQIKIEMEIFRRREFGSHFLVSAPVMLCLSSHPDLYDREIIKGVKNIENCHFNNIHDFICKTSAIEECLTMQSDLTKEAFQHLDKFNDTAAKNSLGDIICALKIQDF